jgi:integrase
MRTKLTPGFISKAEPPTATDRVIYWDEAMPGFGLMVTRAGHKSFILQYRASHRSRRMLIGDSKKIGLDKARNEAKKALGGVASGGDPLQERRKIEAQAENTFQSICEEYLRREGARLRSKSQLEGALRRVVYVKPDSSEPRLGSRQIDDIRRSDIVRLLDKIEDERGPVAADFALAVIRKIMSWHARRSDDFRSPIVSGMARSNPSERKRERILSDDELRAFWKASGESTGPFGPLLRFTLLTAARRMEAASLTHRDIVDGDWIIPGTRYKTKTETVLPLSKAAQDVLVSVPRIEGVDYVFTTGTKPIGGFSQFKSKFDQKAGLSDWTIHDLRRTARSLMSRAGVPTDHAERCLGHAMGGVRGTYDRHAYHAEKKQAFEALAAQIDRIINPQANVIPMRNLEIPA